MTYRFVTMFTRLEIKKIYMIIKPSSFILITYRKEAIETIL